jgi:hypothetical protein
MKFTLRCKLISLLSVVFFALIAVAAISAQDTDLTSHYQWNPVQIGAGGWMRGLAVSGSAAYARGDVDNVYRWDGTANQWFPTKISGALPAAFTVAPANAGGGAIAIDPSNTKHVLVAWRLCGSGDIGNCWGLNVYYSTDGALTYKAANLALTGDLSSETTGERMVVDPSNGNVAYFGPPGGSGSPDGLQRSLDGGATWAQVTGGGLPASTSSVRYEFHLPRIDGGSGTGTVGGQTASKIVYVTYIKHNESSGDIVSGGGVLKSADGGNTWTDITGTALESGAATAGFATVDASGNLWIADGGSNNLYEWTRAGSAWMTATPQHGGGSGIAVDPSNTQRIFALGGGNGLSRSLDGGKTWTDLGGMQFSTTQPIEWLRPQADRPQGHYVSTSGLYFDGSGTLWVAGANDGIMTYTPGNTDTSSTWTSNSEGIEEAVAEPAVIPPGGKPLLPVEDETMFIITDPSTYTAAHFPLDLWTDGSGLACATDSNYLPNQPLFDVISTFNVATGNVLALAGNFSGYSTDGGTTWQVFPSISAGTHPCVLEGGSIAVSARAAGHVNDPAGADNLVWIPTNANTWTAKVPAPFYSKDGGATWTQTTSFNNVSGASTVATPCGSGPSSFTYMPTQWGPWNYVLSQHLLVADPVTPGTFYVHMTAGGFWKSTDGGVTWTQQTATGAPGYPHHGTLATVPGVSGEMWLVDGREGATAHGLYHTTDGGNNFTRNANFTYAWTLALGKAAPGQSYPAIYVYGLYNGDAKWGIFQSVDGGNTFNRVSYYPYNIIDMPNTMAASWDVFGTVYLGFVGNTFYYGTYNDTVDAPGKPTLSATAGDTVVNLSWTPAYPGGTPTSFSLYRGTAAGKESSTAIATFDGSTFAYQDTGLTDGTQYFYYLTSTNSIATSANSAEVSATPASAVPPAISLGAGTSGNTSATVTAGQTATFNLTLSSTNYAGVVTFTCTGAPAGATCTVPSPETLTAATTSTPVAITVQTVAANAMLETHPTVLLGMLPWMAGLLCIPLCFKRKLVGGIATLLLTAALLAIVSGCGGGGSSSNNTPPPPANYYLTITATGTNGVTPASAALTLTVNQ